MSVPLLRFTGKLAELDPLRLRQLLDREQSDDDLVRDLAASIIDAVRTQGDDALKSLAREYDGVKLESLEVDRTEWKRSLDRTDPGVVRGLERLMSNLTLVHHAQLPSAVSVAVEPGVTVEWIPKPLASAGVYVPGGKASYPSSLLMGAIPARIAGVASVVVCSPPGRGTGRPADLVMAACELAGVSRLFAVGGAGAIAALAFGTDSVPRVDRIVGPGNAWVAAAKTLVSNRVAIDAPAGPSEVLVIADGSAEPEFVARELVAQAEHDERAAVIAVIIGDELAARVEESLRLQSRATARATIVRKALASRGALLTTDSPEAALAFANYWAAEHVVLAVGDPRSFADRLCTTGAIFVGHSSSVVFGDYMTGANHTLPTGGAARSYSGLSVFDFLRWTSVQTVSAPAAAAMASDVEILASAEGLDAHARAAAAFRGVST
ncbi:MAG: histidinol dehydrogenase [Gemmatimonadota bacterium]